MNTNTHDHVDHTINTELDNIDNERSEVCDTPTNRKHANEHTIAEFSMEEQNAETENAARIPVTNMDNKTEESKSCTNDQASDQKDPVDTVVYLQLIS